MAAPKPARVPKAAAPKDAEAARKKATAAKKAAVPRIKSAPTPYNLFVKAKMPEVLSSAPPGEKKSSLSMGKIASMWNQLPEEAKQPYQAQAQELKADVNARKLEAKAEKKRNARPLPPFFAFTVKHYAAYREQYPDLKLSEVTKKLSQAYRAIPQDEKAAMCAEYHSQIAVWKSKQQAKAAAA